MNLNNSDPVLKSEFLINPDPYKSFFHSCNKNICFHILTLFVHLVTRRISVHLGYLFVEVCKLIKDSVISERNVLRRQQGHGISL